MFLVFIRIGLSVDQVAEFAFGMRVPWENFLPKGFHPDFRQ
jgi:hypothetical protein